MRALREEYGARGAPIDDALAALLPMTWASEAATAECLGAWEDWEGHVKAVEQARDTLLANAAYFEDLAEARDEIAEASERLLERLRHIQWVEQIREALFMGQGWALDEQGHMAKRGGRGRPALLYNRIVGDFYDALAPYYGRAFGDAAKNARGLREQIAVLLRLLGFPDDLLDPGSRGPITVAINGRLAEHRRADADKKRRPRERKGRVKGPR
ncbi:hypothetical protein BH18GEM1_BH18GEM1_22430 [soil metagenome]